MRRWLRTAPTGACPQPGHSSGSLWTCSPLPHLCLYHRIISSPGRSRLVTNPETLCQAPPASLITGKGSSSWFHSRQRLFAQRLPDSDEPVFRVLLAVGYPVWYGSPPPTVDLSRPRWRPVCGAGHASLVRQRSDTARTELRRHSPTGSLRSARLCPRRSTAATRAIPSRVRPQASPCPPHKADAPTLRSTLAVADSSRYVAVPKLRMHYQLRPRSSVVRAGLVLLVAVVAPAPLTRQVGVSTSVACGHVQRGRAQGERLCTKLTISAFTLCDAPSALVG